MDDALRASLWNEIMVRFSVGNKHWGAAAQAIAKFHLKIPTDTVSEYNDAGYKWVREQFFAASWHEAYDLLEFLVQNVDRICDPPSYRPSYYQTQRHAFMQAVNQILETELSAYRFIGGSLVPISNPTEVAAIEGAIAGGAAAGLAGVHAHLQSSLENLGRKPVADYRNSIKESISAVEATVNLIAGGSGNGVAGALDALSQHTELHGAFKAALKQLYGYTSDADGIRHAILDEPNVDFEDAKFMLVACSAFTTFFLGKASKAGLVPRAG